MCCPFGCTSLLEQNQNIMPTTDEKPNEIQLGKKKTSLGKLLVDQHHHFFPFLASRMYFLQ